MKVSIGKRLKKELLDIRLGEQAVTKQYLGTKQIWPDISTRVTRMTVNTEPISGTINGLYWIHAIALTSVASNTNQYIRIAAGERSFNVNTTYGTYHLATYSNGSFSFASGQGPLASKVRVGDKITCTLVAPQHESEKIAGGYSEWSGSNALPFIEKTNLYTCSLKGQKRISICTMAKMTGKQSGTEHYNYTWYKYGHCRGWYDHTTRYDGSTTGTGDGYSCKTLNTDEIPTDTYSYIECWIGNTAEGYAIAKYPAFRKQFEFTVTGIVSSKASS